MTREEALRSFTIWAAYGQFEDKIKGSLEEGKLADFVVIDRDYMTCPSSDIKDILPLTTVVGGEVVYTKDNSNVTVVFQGDKMVFDSAPVLENGTTYVLAKNLFVSLGLEFTYDEVNNKYYVNNGSSKIEIDAKDGVYVPLRAAAESLGYKINWYQSSMSVSIGK